MINGVIIKKIVINNDARGWLGEIYRTDETEYKPEMAYVSLTNPGVVRGPHEHKFQSDMFVFMGPGEYELHLWDNREGSETKGEYQKISAGEKNPMSVIIPPGIVHAYKCVSDIPGYSINFPDKLYKGKNKAEEVDEIRWENDANSPFKIN